MNMMTAIVPPAATATVPSWPEWRAKVEHFRRCYAESARPHPGDEALPGKSVEDDRALADQKVLCERSWEAEYAIYKTPAPNERALREKMEVFRDHGIGCDGQKEHLQLIIDDFVRLNSLTFDHAAWNAASTDPDEAGDPALEVWRRASAHWESYKEDGDNEGWNRTVDELDAELARTPATTLRGVAAKLRRVDRDEMFNDPLNSVLKGAIAELEGWEAASEAHGRRNEADEGGDPTDSRRLWDAAMAEYRAGVAVADAMSENDPDIDEAVERYSAAQDRLIERVPAPGFAEVEAKLDIALHRASDFQDLVFEEHAQPILADVDRLAGEDGECCMALRRIVGTLLRAGRA